MTPPKREDKGGEENSVMACALVRDSATVSTVMQELDVPEMLADSMSVAIPVKKEPVLVGGAPSGELDGECEDRIGVPPDYWPSLDPWRSWRSGRPLMRVQMRRYRRQGHG